MKVHIILAFLSAVRTAPLNSFAGDTAADGLSDYAPNFAYKTFQTVDLPSSKVSMVSIPVSQSSSAVTNVRTKFNGAEGFISDAATNAYHYITPLYDTVVTGATDVLNTTTETAKNVGKQASQLVRQVSSDVSNAAYKTKTFIIHTTTEAEGFFSSTFKSIKSWFANLEDEVKALLHFLLRVVEVVAVVVILIVFLWILKRVTSGYKFLKSVADTFELHDRTVS